MINHMSIVMFIFIFKLYKYDVTPTRVVNQSPPSAELKP
jgi:hypothetical protein